MSKPSKIVAVLVRGQTYILRDKRFDHGQPVEVTEDEKAHLTEHAIDVVSRPGDEEGEVEAVPLQKFRFENA